MKRQLARNVYENVIAASKSFLDKEGNKQTKREAMFCVVKSLKDMRELKPSLLITRMTTTFGFTH
jgi:hypothetical protein